MDILSLFPTFDAFLLTAFVAVFLIHLLFVQINRIVVDVMAVCMSFALVVFGPLVSSEVASWMSIHPLVRLVLFVASTVLFHVVFWRSNIGGFAMQLDLSGVFMSLVYRFCVVGLFFSTMLVFAPGEVQSQMGVLTTWLFGNLTALFIWFSLPLFAAFVYRFHTRNGWIQ